MHEISSKANPGAHEMESPILTEPSKLPGRLRELRKLYKFLEPARINPEAFWNEHKNNIIEGLQKVFNAQDSETPEIEVIVPVYKNYKDLVGLLYTLARQEVEGLGTIKLTFCMHNNIGDQSWDLVSDLRNGGFNLNTEPLAHPLLTGPYISWQYLLATGQGKQLAVLDADSVCSPHWIKNITQPLRDNPNVSLACGLRWMQGYFLESVSSVSYLIFKTIAATLTGKYPNLPLESRYVGGQAAYDSSEAKRIIDIILGLPAGDGMFGWILESDPENLRSQYVPEAVANEMDSYRKFVSIKDVFNKSRRVVGEIIPQLKHKSREATEENIILGIKEYFFTINRYCHWFRPFYAEFEKCFEQKTPLTKEMIFKIAEEIIRSKGLEPAICEDEVSKLKTRLDNIIADEKCTEYSRHKIVMDPRIFDSYETYESLIGLANTLGYLMIRPIMQEKMSGDKQPSS